MDFFNFEDKERDFPFYNDKPELSIGKWLLLIASIFFVAFYIATPMPAFFSANMGIILFAVLFLVIYYVSKGNLGLFFRKITGNDVKFIILCLIGVLLYSTVMNMIIGNLGWTPVANGIVNESYDLHFLIVYLFLIMSEEFLKLITFLVSLNFTNKALGDRKKAIIVSAVVAALLFGIFHYTSYSGNWAQIILVIGLSTLFDMFLYVKTKNLAASYILHLLTDFPIWATAIATIITTLVH